MAGPLTLLAWVGIDERGSGVVGLKQALVAAGLIPLVAIGDHREKITRDDVIAQLQAQADHYGVDIRLARFAFVEDEIVLTPRRRRAS